jgi:hypothetical protein
MLPEEEEMFAPEFVKLPEPEKVAFPTVWIAA